jgi:hypothetical protein
MGKTIYVRNVPDGTYEALRRRSEAEGMNLSDYLNRELGRLVQWLSLEERLERAEGRAPMELSSEEIVNAIRDPFSSEEFENSPIAGANAYRVEGVTPDHPCVELWSTQRLPFEPKGLVLAMRNDLRRSLLGLEVKPHQVLHAAYASAVLGKFDIENVLFYNVGARYFASTIGRGIRFERSFTYPTDARSRYSAEAKHHHSYAAAPREGSFLHWRRGQDLIRWTEVPCRQIRADTNPAWIWHTIRCSSERIQCFGVANSAQYGMSIMLRGPDADSRKPSSSHQTARRRSRLFVSRLGRHTACFARHLNSESSRRRFGFDREAIPELRLLGPGSVPIRPLVSRHRRLSVESS